jgi:hypothetical protein
LLDGRVELIGDFGRHKNALFAQRQARPIYVGFGLNIGSDDPHRWFLFRPPFFGFDLRATTVVSDNARVDWQNVLNRQLD